MELRSQCAPAGESVAEVSAADVAGHTEHGAATAAGDSLSGTDHDTLRTAVLFSASWMLPRNSGDKGRTDTDGEAFDSQQGGRPGFKDVYVTGASLGWCSSFSVRLHVAPRAAPPLIPGDGSRCLPIWAAAHRPLCVQAVHHTTPVIPYTICVANESDAVFSFNSFSERHVGIHVSIDPIINCIC
ncbi:hypothetical protein Q4I32_005653 [Leishmania shawi]|uniref:Uncharacterized protein n=1 Tax=Leishmania shawi TaxID=5680 RepID=A0AAW3BKE9_9TRYP